MADFLFVIFKSWNLQIHLVRLTLLLQGTPKTDIYCDFMSTTKGSVPDHPFPYSDHEALTAQLRLKPSVPAEAGGDKQPTAHDSPAGI